MTDGPSLAPRRLDHVVMPVGSLAISTAFFEGLGFQVAPEAVHPFGTKNACVFFAHGAYVEPLAIASRETCEAEALRGNAFVARDAAYRFRNGVPGFSALSVSSDDATADLGAFRDGGIAGGDLLNFSRLFTDPSGSQRALSFRLAFAADLRAPDAFFFACQGIGTAADRSRLTRHPNGATALRRIVMAEPNPSDFQDLLQTVMRTRDVNAMSFGLSIETSGGVVDVLTPTGLDLHYGARRGEVRGLSIEGVVVGVPDLAVVKAIAASAEIVVEERGGRLIARLSPEGSQFLAFERDDER